MRKLIYLPLIMILIYVQVVITLLIDNAWIELLVLPIIVGCSAGWLYSKALKECRKETIYETLKTMVEVEIEMTLNGEENNEQSKETME
jgi:hypothetical protein